MSKKNKNKTKENISNITLDPHRLESTVKQNTLFKKLFLYSAVFMLLLMPALSFQYGISGDETDMHTYGNDVLSFFSSFGKEKKCVNEKNILRFYGGLFDVVTESVNKIFSISDVYRSRHFINAIFGFFAMFFTGLLAQQIGGWRTGLIALWLIFLSPVFFGHSMNNPKDIPFATFYAMALYVMIRFLKDLPKPSRKIVLLLIVAIAGAINIRVGGLLLIAYLFLFVGIESMVIITSGSFSNFKKINFNNLLPFLKIVLLTGVISYFAGSLFWPYGLLNPVFNPINALQEMSNYPVNIKILFDGEHIWSNDIPWFYIFKWMWISNPLIITFGFLLFIPSLLFIKKYYRTRYVLFVLFAAIFPVVYAVYKKSVLYDGWRHFLFVYPAMVVCIAVFWDFLLNSLDSQKYIQRVIAGLIIGMMSLPLVWMIRNHPNEAVYFNELSGGTKNNYGKYEMDYYMNSLLPASEWLKNQPEVKNPSGEIKIVTNCINPLNYYFSKNTSDKVKVAYTRYYDRSEKDWDYAIFYSRFVDRSQLKNKSWPPKNVVYAVKADGIPLAVVVKRDDKSDFYGHEAINKSDFKNAIQYFMKAVDYDNKNESAWLGLAEAYLNMNNLQLASNAVQQSLNLYPDNQMALNMMGVIYMREQQYDRAILTYNRLIKINPGFDNAYLNMGAAYAQKGNIEAAIAYLKQTVMINPRNQQAYLLLANIYQQKGDNRSAQEYMSRARQLQGN